MKPITTTRRALLASLAASAATAASSASPEAAETPEMVALADQLEPTLAAHLSTVERVQQIMAEWQPKVSKSPTITLPNGHETDLVRYGEGSRPYTDIAGKPLQLPWGKRGLKKTCNFGTSETFGASAAKHRKEADRKSSFKSKRGMNQEIYWAKNDEAMIEPARAYWAEFDRIVKASKIKDAKRAESATREALRCLVGEIIGYSESSVTGLVIKAEALTAWGQVDRSYVLANPDAAKWSRQISSSILRQIAPQ